MIGKSRERRDRDPSVRPRRRIPKTLPECRSRSGPCSARVACFIVSHRGLLFAMRPNTSAQHVLTGAPQSDAAEAMALSVACPPGLPSGSRGPSQQFMSLDPPSPWQDRHWLCGRVSSGQAEMLSFGFRVRSLLGEMGHRTERLWHHCLLVIRCGPSQGLAPLSTRSGGAAESRSANQWTSNVETCSRPA